MERVFKASAIYPHPVLFLLNLFYTPSGYLSTLLVTVQTIILVDRFHAYMKSVCLKMPIGHFMIELSAKLHEHRILQMRQIAAKHAKNFANGASELLHFSGAKVKNS